jgi:hypothetical protein
MAEVNWIYWKILKWSSKQLLAQGRHYNHHYRKNNKNLGVIDGNSWPPEIRKEFTFLPLSCSSQ